MNSKIKFNHASLRSVEAKAIKAASIAAKAAKKKSSNTKEGRDRQPVNKPPKKRKSTLPKIDRDIQAIFKAINTRISDDMIAVLEKPSKGLSCKAIIRIYTETAEKEDLKKRKALMTYVFYPSSLSNTRLGSVAIYCDNAASYLAGIQNRGSLFGQRFVSATLEIGRRPFIDVKFRA